MIILFILKGVFNIINQAIMSYPLKNTELL